MTLINLSLDPRITLTDYSYADYYLIPNLPDESLKQGRNASYGAWFPSNYEYSPTSVHHHDKGKDQAKIRQKTTL